MQGNSVVIKYIVMLPQPAATAPYFSQLYSSTSVKDSVNLALFLKSPSLSYSSISAFSELYSCKSSVLWYVNKLI